MSHVMKKPAFCICENKDADQLHSKCAADQRLCFRYIYSTIPRYFLDPKFQASGHLWLYSLVCIGTGRNPLKTCFLMIRFICLYWLWSIKVELDYFQSLPYTCLKNKGPVFLTQTCLCSTRREIEALNFKNRVKNKIILSMKHKQSFCMDAQLIFYCEFHIYEIACFLGSCIRYLVRFLSSCGQSASSTHKGVAKSIRR